MTELSRRKFLGAAAGGAVVAGAAAIAAPSLLGGEANTPAGGPTERRGEPLNIDGPVLAHVRNATTGEISVFSGTREVVIRNRAVAHALLSAAQ